MPHGVDMTMLEGGAGTRPDGEEIMLCDSKLVERWTGSRKLDGGTTKNPNDPGGLPLQEVCPKIGTFTKLPQDGNH